MKKKKFTLPLLTFGQYLDHTQFLYYGIRDIDSLEFMRFQEYNMAVLEDNDNQLDTQINEDIGVNSEIPINVDTPEIIDIPKCFDTPKHTEKENIQMKILDLCSKLYEIDRKNQESQKKKIVLSFKTLSKHLKRIQINQNST